MRSIVKHSYIKTGINAAARAGAHVRYLRFRPGKDKNEQPSRRFFNDKSTGLTGRHVQDAIRQQPKRGTLIHKLILSPGVQDAVIEDYVREIITDLASQKGLDLEWFGIVHRNTEHPHAHIVLMGTDRNGRRVWLRKEDYLRARETGDRYLERNRLLDTGKSKDRKDRALLDRLKEVIVTAGQKFASLLSPDCAPKNPWSFEQGFQRTEHISLGKPPDNFDLAKNEIKHSQAEERKRIKLWQEYCQPIKIVNGDANHPEMIEYNPKSSLFSLRQLEHDDLAGNEEVTSSVSSEQFARLQKWIKDQCRAKKQLESDAEKIARIEMHFPEADPIVLSERSTPAELRALRRMHDRGYVVLSDAEVHAVDKWIVIAERASAKTGKLYQLAVKPLSYDRLKQRLNTSAKQPQESKPVQAPKQRRWLRSRGKKDFLDKDTK